MSLETSQSQILFAKEGPFSSPSTDTGNENSFLDSPDITYLRELALDEQTSPHEVRRLAKLMEQHPLVAITLVKDLGGLGRYQLPLELIQKQLNMDIQLAKKMGVPTRVTSDQLKIIRKCATEYQHAINPDRYRTQAEQRTYQKDASAIGQPYNLSMDGVFPGFEPDYHWPYVVSRLATVDALRTIAKQRMNPPAAASNS